MCLYKVLSLVNEDINSVVTSISYYLRESLKVLITLNAIASRWYITWLEEVNISLISKQVETIGDAYMFVSGVPEVTDRHAQKVANCSLDMVTVVEEVMSPATGKPIQVRNRDA